MTFTEAAEAVLRKINKPLHYKKITEIAIEDNLLSHVGKTPEVTMSTRLATLAKKDRGDAAIVRIKPGVFGLRVWGPAAVAAAADEPEGEEITDPAIAETDESADIAPGSESDRAEERERAQRVAAASQLFPEEADDDLPVFAERPAPAGAAAPASGPSAPRPAANGTAVEGDREGGRRRRRRRRRGRGTDRVDGATGTSEPWTVEPPEGAAETDEAGDDLLPDEDDNGSDDNGGDGLRVSEGSSSASGEESAGEGGQPRTERREPREPREHREPREPIRLEETGRDAADLVVSLLARRDDRTAVSLRNLAEEASRAGRMAGDANMLASTLAAAVRVDGARREAKGERSRMRLAGGRVSLVDWSLGTDVVRAESDALAAIERLRDAARRQVLRKLNELPQAGFVEILVMLLEKLGISSLRNQRRPGLPQGEIHLAGIARRAGEEIKIAAVLKRGGEIGRERVIEVRGSLHHYGPAQAAWIVTSGNVLSGARDEAAQTGAAPVTLVDSTALGRLLDEHAVGIRHARVALPYVDLDLMESLRGN